LVVAELDDAWRAAREVWPQLPDDREGFARRVAELGAPTYPADVYLALHAAAGFAPAVEAFLAGPFLVARSTLRKLRCAPDLVDELEQQLRAMFLVAPAKLATYAGRGPLASWVASIAARVARKRLANEQRRAPDDESLGDLAADDDPELAYLKTAYRDAFAAAVTDALAELTVRERNLLRQHHLDGLTLDELAVLYDVHRATIARWLAAARDQIVAGSRTLLASRIAIDPEELESIVRLVESQVQLSLRRLLGS
jgi:RNA polymerase sigma-70 factor, ECF subfamily